MLLLLLIGDDFLIICAAGVCEKSALKSNIVAGVLSDAGARG